MKTEIKEILKKNKYVCKTIMVSGKWQQLKEITNTNAHSESENKFKAMREAEFEIEPDKIGQEKGRGRGGERAHQTVFRNLSFNAF